MSQTVVHTQETRDLDITSISFGAAIFISAFLLFQVQPMMAKHLLPWFGHAFGMDDMSVLLPTAPAGGLFVRAFSGAESPGHTAYVALGPDGRCHRSHARTSRGVALSASSRSKLAAKITWKSGRTSSHLHVPAEEGKQTHGVPMPPEDKFQLWTDDYSKFWSVLKR